MSAAIPPPNGAQLSAEAKALLEGKRTPRKRSSASLGKAPPARVIDLAEASRRASARDAAADNWRLPDGLAGFAVPLDQIAERAPTFAIEGLLEVDEFALLAGVEILSAKSMLMVDLGVARVLGASWLGFKVASCKPARVLYIASEGGASVVKRRVRRFCLGRGVDPALVEPFIVVIAGRVPLLPKAERERVADAAFATLRRDYLRTHDAEQREQIADMRGQVVKDALRTLAPNIDRLEAIHDAPCGTWGLIVVDTVRKNLVGDENSSADAGKFTAAAEELAHAQRCPLVGLHHTGKGTDGSQMRAARGSSELTAGPRVVLTVDTSGDWRTLHAQTNNRVPPEPVGFELVDTAEGGLRFEVREPCSASGGARVEDSEVEAALRGEQEPLALSRIRGAIAVARGGKPGGKANQRSTEAAIARCLKRGTISEAPIRTSKGAITGYRLGQDARPGRATAAPQQLPPEVEAVLKRAGEQARKP